ncbi:hypothetical protein SAY87_031999 [Trapa incisa]|uniref:Uncharacterized protein n=1 Tax=Trapa incisa TaxID=236973 RepID=A0AAN7QLG4_9MYRT|nr:hypothetical protein SAY87_031999 [Trapa incisa]
MFLFDAFSTGSHHHSLVFFLSLRLYSTMMGLNIKNTAMGMAKSVALTPLKALLHLCFFFLSLILARSSLLRVQPPPGRREGETSEEPPTLNDLYVLVMDGGAPSLVHVRVLTSHFKNRVPVVEFGELVERRHGTATAAATSLDDHPGGGDYIGTKTRDV